MDRDKYLGGRGMAIPFQGYRLNLGGHLLEGSGSEITKIISYIGGNLEHGPTSKGMPVWVGDRETGAAALPDCDIDFKELDNYDDVPLRTWLKKYTSSEGVIALFEYITAAEAMTETECVISTLPGLDLSHIPVGQFFLAHEIELRSTPHLFNCGFVFQGLRSPQWLEKHFDLIEQDLKQFYPDTWTDKKMLWKKRHLVAQPAFGVIQKPGLVGKYRPDYSAPNIDGLFFASETFRSRGIGVDRAARAGMTCAERALGKRIPEFKDSWHD